jgi:antirestriction protein ArdC
MSTIKEDITALLVKALEEGNAPWRKGWVGGMAPTSLATGKGYQGINTLILSLLGEEYSHPLWLTFKQAQALGGSVKKGEKSVRVVYAAQKSTEPAKEGEKGTSFFFYKWFNVFNVDQCEGIEIPAKFLPTGKIVEPLDAINAIWNGYANRPEMFYSEQGRAFYSPSADSITLPTLAQFKSAEEHAYTFAHEMIHSTGHESRANRWSTKEDKPSAFGCESYAKEELIAEVGACMLLANAGVQFDIPNSAAYLRSWIKALNDDKGLIFKASAKAQAAANYIQGVKVEEEVAA